MPRKKTAEVEPGVVRVLSDEDHEREENERAIYGLRRELLEIERNVNSNQGLIMPHEEARINEIVSAEMNLAGAIVLFYKKRAERLDSLIKQARNLIDKWAGREYTYRAMLTKKMIETETPQVTDWRGTFMVSLQKGRMGLVIDDPAAVPSHFCKAEPDRTVIKAALESGGMVPGCRLAPGESFIVIRVKNAAMLEQDLVDAIQQGEKFPELIWGKSGYIIDADEETQVE